MFRCLQHSYRLSRAYTSRGFTWSSSPTNSMPSADLLCFNISSRFLCSRSLLSLSCAWNEVFASQEIMQAWRVSSLCTFASSCHDPSFHLHSQKNNKCGWAKTAMEEPLACMPVQRFSSSTLQWLTRGEFRRHTLVDSLSLRKSPPAPTMMTPTQSLLLCGKKRRHDREKSSLYTPFPSCLSLHSLPFLFWTRLHDALAPNFHNLSAVSGLLLLSSFAAKMAQKDWDH